MIPVVLIFFAIFLLTHLEIAIKSYPPKGVLHERLRILKRWGFIEGGGGKAIRTARDGVRSDDKNSSKWMH
jgi:hypothetical protein